MPLRLHVRTSAATFRDSSSDLSQVYHTIELGAVQSGTWFGTITMRCFGVIVSRSAVFASTLVLTTKDGSDLTNARPPPKEAVEPAFIDGNKNAFD